MHTHVHMLLLLLSEFNLLLRFCLGLCDCCGHAVAGLCLTDDRVVAAAAATKQLRYARLADHVAALLKCTPPERADQHSGLTPLMRFACTAKKEDPRSTEVRRPQPYYAPCAQTDQVPLMVLSTCHCLVL